MTDAIRKAAQDFSDYVHAEQSSTDGAVQYSTAQNNRLVFAIRAALQQPDDAKQRLLEIMRRNGLATGHGDTLKQVIDTLEVELTDTLEAVRKDAARFRWALPFITGVDSDMADNRALLIAFQLARGLDGGEAIDAAMQGDQDGTR